MEKLSVAKDIPERNIKHMDNDSLLKSKIRIFITINHMLIQLIGKVYNFHIVSAPIERRLTIYVKHMVAIFQIIKDISWESLPEAYKIFPYFSLDISIIFSTRAHSTQQRKYSSRWTRRIWTNHVRKYAKKNVSKNIKHKFMQKTPRTKVNPRFRLCKIC